MKSDSILNSLTNKLRQNYVDAQYIQRRYGHTRPSSTCKVNTMYEAAQNMTLQIRKENQRIGQIAIEEMQLRKRMEQEIDLIRLAYNQLSHTYSQERRQLSRVGIKENMSQTMAKHASKKESFERRRIKEFVSVECQTDITWLEDEEKEEEQKATATPPTVKTARNCQSQLQLIKDNLILKKSVQELTEELEALKMAENCRRRQKELQGIRVRNFLKGLQLNYKTIDYVRQCPILCNPSQTMAEDVIREHFLYLVYLANSECQQYRQNIVQLEKQVDGESRINVQNEAKISKLRELLRSLSESVSSDVSKEAVKAIVRKMQQLSNK